MKLTFSLSGLALALFGALAPAGAAPSSPFHFAHRGGLREFEENTMFAFKSSYENGLRGYELDVRMTKDGELVVLHDDKLDRTHDGTGSVEHFNAEELRGIKSKNQHEPLLFL